MGGWGKGGVNSEAFLGRNHPPQPTQSTCSIEQPEFPGPPPDTIHKDTFDRIRLSHPWISNGYISAKHIQDSIKLLTLTPRLWLWTECPEQSVSGFTLTGQ